MDDGGVATAEKASSDARADADDRPTSPAEQVEQRLQVTSPRMWLALAAFFVIIVSAIVWGVLGKAADEVRGRGAILPTAGLYEIAAPVDGAITTLSIKVGDHVEDHKSLMDLTTARGETGQVGSAVPGKVAALYVQLGSFVKTGTPIATIEPDNSDLHGLLYVPAAGGKNLKPGMPVYLSPSTAPASQYGSMVGTVASVSELAVTRDRLTLTLGQNAPLVDVLLADGPSLEVAVQLERADTPSGYKWSSGNGPDFAITAGTLVDGSVVVREGSPTKVILGS